MPSGTLKPNKLYYRSIGRQDVISTGVLQIDLVKGMMDCLYAECKPCITDCVIAELEKLGQRYKVALKVAKVESSSHDS